MYFRPFTAVKLFKSTALVGVGLQLLWILLYTYRFGEKKVKAVSPSRRSSAGDR